MAKREGDSSSFQHSWITHNTDDALFHARLKVSLLVYQFEFASNFFLFF